MLFLPQSYPAGMKAPGKLDWHQHTLKKQVETMIMEIVLCLFDGTDCALQCWCHKC